MPTNCLSVFDHFVGLALKELRDRTLVNHNESPELINKFLQTNAYDFIDDLIKEIDTALKDDSPIISAFNVFLPSEATSLIDSNAQSEILPYHYGKDIPKVNPHLLVN